MALSADTLATELKNIGEPENDEELKNAWGDAWVTYWEESEATYLTTTVGANSAPAVAVTAFKDQIVLLNNPDNTALAAAGIILDACKDFWTEAVPPLAYITIPPPAGPYVLVPPFMLNPAAEAVWIAALVAVFTANTTGGLSVDDSMDAIATAIHTGQAGATFLDTTPPAGGGPFTYVVS